MKICVVGAGAIGGYLAVELAASGQEVTVVARGPHLDAICRHGLRLVYGDGVERVARVEASERCTDIGRYDVVVIALKAHQIAPVAADMVHLFLEHTAVVTIQNGVPWWYFHRSVGRFPGRVLQSVDPGGVISRHIDARRVVHCVAYPAAEVAAPGVIRHHEGNRFPVGEPDDAITPRVQEISSMLASAGFKAPVLADTRGEVWLKLLGNATFNPISALTRASVGEMCAHALTRSLIAEAMREARLVAEALEVRIRLPIERRIAGAEKLGSHRMSMLQDVEAGRELEIDALVGAIVELGGLTGVATPSLKTLYACTKLLDHVLRDSRARHTGA